MTYSFLPYYWSARKSRWVQTTQLEDNDHIFQAFLQAGMARVLVPVHPGMEKSVMHFLSSGNMMMGDNLPSLTGIFSDIEIDLAKEDDFSDIPEEERTWELRVPSTLTALQKGTSAIEEDGLPCSCKKEGEEGWGIGVPFPMVGVDNNDNTGGQ